MNKTNPHAVSPLALQIGGDHYKGYAIQPVEFIEKNGLTFLEGCIVKRIARHRLVGGKGREDLEKIKHEVDLIIELHYSNTDGDDSDSYGGTK